MNLRMAPYAIFLSCLLKLTLPLGAAPIEATIGYMFAPYNFASGDHALGHVTFKNGFSIPPSGTVIFDTDGVAMGALNLNGSGTIKLNADFKLGTSATFTQSGLIDGGGHSLTLTSSLKLPALTTLRFTGNTIVNGQGNTLTLDNGSQLLVDNNVSVTLRNIVIQSSYNNASAQPLGMNGANAHLSLDSVVLRLSNHMSFPAGKLFINNDVSITGTSTFSYRSSQASYIMPFSTLYVDHGAMLAYTPGVNNHNLLRLADKTSALYLNGCTFKTTGTGMQLMRGQLFFDNRVILNTALDLPNALTFGDDTNTSNNLNVKVLGNARIEVNGMIHDATV